MGDGSATSVYRILCPVPVLAEITTHCDALLHPDQFLDYGPNGVQVPGADEVAVIATGVTASLELISRAAAHGADLLIVHHGLIWDWDPRTIDRLLADRLKALFAHDMSLAMYHICLDAHPDLGNNARLAQALGAQQIDPFGRHGDRTIGVVATFAGEGIPIAELRERVSTATGQRPFCWESGPPVVRRLGMVTGAGAMEGTRWLRDSARAGFDAYLTGEATEHTMMEARELGIHFVAAGHYATETFGVRALGQHLAERFDVEHVFIDIPNPV